MNRKRTYARYIYNRDRITLVIILFLIGLTCPSEALHGDEGEKLLQPDKLLEDRDAPLDKRINPEKITEQPLPQLPQRVLDPQPPVHHIAWSPGRVPISRYHYTLALNSVQTGLTLLREAQSESGGWMTEVMAQPTDHPNKPSPISAAVTAMALKAIVQAEKNPLIAPSVMEASEYIRIAQRKDGSYDGGSLANYVTASVASVLASFNNEEFADEVAAATGWLMDAQWDQGEGLTARQDWFGGAGYGNRGRPDLSNTQMMLDALYDAGLSPDEPAFQRALAFVSRAQNLRATNQSTWASNDGGFIYTPANGGESMASEYAGEGRQGQDMPPGQPRSLRSYGSMTYAGFKSMLYAGLSPDDVRVRAAFDWIRRHFTFQENPGIGQQGLYYYFHTMSRALRMAQQDIITDTQGVEHNWREELIEAIVARQKEDGSWQNDEDRWLEGHPVMATTFAVLALEEALKPTPEDPDSGDTDD